MQKRLPSLDQEGVSADPESSLLKLRIKAGPTWIYFSGESQVG